MSTQAKPNVIVILVDDLPWPDVSAYGEKRVATPNIDRIAKSGVAFTNGYVAASVCAMSRAALLTGRYPQRFGFQYNLDDEANRDQGLDLSQKTVADRLKKAGYHTGAIGKWHQGYTAPFYPMRRGFDEFFGFLSGETVYVDPKTPGIVTTPTAKDHYPIDYRRPGGGIVEGANATPVNDFNKYLTTELTDKAIDFVDRNGGRASPYFMYLAYNAPHWPLQVPKSYYDKLSGIKDPIRRTYVAMISALDDNVGRLLDELDRRHQRDNTLIVFLSDNGCPNQFGFCDCSHPLGAGKFTYVEGGTRIPFLMSWPRGFKPHAPIDTPVSSLDILPTVLEASHDDDRAGLDGRDLLGLVHGKPWGPRTLFWGQEPVLAARSGRWKEWKSMEDGKTSLFDLETDPGELKDLAATEPAVLRRIDGELEAWHRQFVPALWPRRTTRQVQMCTKPTTYVY